MSTAASSSSQNTDFSRLVLQNRLSRAPYGIALYPLTNLGVSIAVNITNTNINFRYDSGSVNIVNVTYSGKTIEDVINEINSQILPVKAVALIKGVTLEEGDLFTYNTSTYFSIPNGFKYYDRLTNNGIVIRSNKLNIQHKSLANFKILPPYNSNVFLPWYPVITNGQFIQRYQEKVYHYSIPEYLNQSWSLRYGKPFRDVFGAKLRRISNNAFAVPRAPIYWTGDNFTLFNGETPVSNSIIEDVDVKNGIIYVSDTRYITEDTEITYSYLENNYEYKGININAHFSQNPNLLEKYVIVYAIPVDGIGYYKTKQSIKHVVGSSVDEAISRIELLNKNAPYVVIGGYCINQITTSDRIKILDTRSLGGGLLSEDGPINPIKRNFYGLVSNTKVFPKIENSYRESSSFWDIGNWDGEIYPGAAAITVGIPDSIRSKMPKDEVESRASKFIAAGVYTIVDYYADDLPAVTGTSAQISLQLNSTLLESINGVSGVCWFKNGVELPGSNTTGAWPQEFGNSTIPYRIDNTGVIATTPEATIYQTYIKSTPIAGIEYRTREVVTVSGAMSEMTELGPWNIVRLEDSREVPDGWITKGYVEFPRSSNSLEIRSLKVNSPYRLDTTGQFRDQLLGEIKTIASGVLERSATGIRQNVNGSGITVEPVIYNRSSIVDEGFYTAPNYFGAGKAYDFLFEFHNSDLYTEIEPLLTTIGNQVASSFTGINGSDYYPMLYKPSGQRYEAFSSGYITGLDFRNFLEQSCKYANWRKCLYGTTDSVFTGLQFRIIEMCQNLNVTTDGYLPKFYNINDAVTNPYFTPVSHIKPQTFGYGDAEVHPEYNRDFDYLYMNPGIYATTLVVSDYAAPETTIVSNLTISAIRGAANALSRFSSALNGTRTFTGLPVVQSWYMPYNRYGKYLGGMCRQFIDCYEYLMESHHCATNVTWNGLSGMDVAAQDWYFSGIEYMLSTAYSGASNVIMRNGVLEPEIADTIYCYGWYAANVHHHHEHKAMYVPGAPMSGHSMSHSNTSISHPLLGQFSGLFMTGLYTLVKGMTTRNASMHETTIINGEHGPFESKVPTKIFDLLSIGCKLDKKLYLPLAQAVFNTVTGNYSVNGVYWTDPTKRIPNAGQEDIIAPYFVRLLKEI